MNEEDAKELVKGIHESRKRNKDIVELLESLVSILKEENQMFRELQQKIIEDTSMGEME